MRVKLPVLVAVVLTFPGQVLLAQKQDPRAEMAQFFGDVNVSIFNLEVGYAVDLTIRGGHQRVAVIVRDELSSVSSTVTIDLEDGRGVEVTSARRTMVEDERQWES